MNAPVDPLYLQRRTETEAVRELRKRVKRAGARCLQRAERTLSRDAGDYMLRAAQKAFAWEHAAATEAQLNNVIIELTALNVAANAAERLESDEGDRS